MRIAVFGLGYVGTVTAGCLARDGHRVIGVDRQKSKVELINEGRTPVSEPSMDEIISGAVAGAQLRATTDAAEAITESELSLICVGTPSQANGNLDVTQVRRVCEEIGQVLSREDHYHVVVIRSTVLPGTMREVVIPTLESTSDKSAGNEFGVCHNPEFLREGSAVDDFLNPPKTVIGEIERRSGDLLAKLYEEADAPLIRTNIDVAEMVKYIDNAWHALKIGFANEIGNICKALDIDSHPVMDIFCLDRKLNLSPEYLRPGFGFGGSCLPKDLRALTYRARRLDLDVPILNAILPSNQRQIERGIQLVMRQGRKKVGVLGFSFKAGTDDLRESPVVHLIEHLIGKGYDIKLYDRNVQLASLVGTNRDYVLNHIPHISRIIVESVDEVLEHAETVVIGNRDPDFRSVLQQLRPDQHLVDLVRIDGPGRENPNYDGICW